MVLRFMRLFYTGVLNRDFHSTHRTFRFGRIDSKIPACILPAVHWQAETNAPATITSGVIKVVNGVTYDMAGNVL